jgi:hypothetical protein
MKTHLGLAAMLASFALQPGEQIGGTDKMEGWRENFFASNPQKVKEIVAESKQKQIDKEARRIQRWSGVK